jgi:hypothetical protein
VEFCSKADASRKGQKADRAVKEAKCTAKMAQIAKVKLIVKKSIMWILSSTWEVSLPVMEATGKRFKLG